MLLWFVLFSIPVVGPAIMIAIVALVACVVIRFAVLQAESKRRIAAKKAARAAKKAARAADLGQFFARFRRV